MEALLSNPPDDQPLNVEPGFALRVTDPQAPAQALLDQLREIHTAPDYTALPLDTKLLIEALNAPSGTRVRGEIAYSSQFVAKRKLPIEQRQFNPNHISTIIEAMEAVNKLPAYRGWYHEELSCLYRALISGETHNAAASSKAEA